MVGEIIVFGMVEGCLGMEVVDIGVNYCLYLEVRGCVCIIGEVGM